MCLAPSQITTKQMFLSLIRVSKHQIPFLAFVRYILFSLISCVQSSLFYAIKAYEGSYHFNSYCIFTYISFLSFPKCTAVCIQLEQEIWVLK